MKRNLGTLICLIFALCLALAGQTDDPTLLSASIPSYPPLARQARVTGTVKITFILAANAPDPVDIRAVSGHPMLTSAAIDNVKTWHFRNTYTVGREYQTAIRYILTDSGPGHVTFESFNAVEVSAPVPIRDHL